MGFYLVKRRTSSARRAENGRRLAERAVFDEFGDQVADPFFRRRDFDEALFLEDDRFDSVNFRRRTGQTATVEVGGNIVKRPFVAKSYPSFFEDFAALGGVVE